ncbi:MAG: protein phosphatase 2C domain-containing protein [Verrucomicrobiota bacterium]
MKVAKDGIRSIVRIGYDGRVHKTFRGTDREARFENEIRVLQVLEERGCDFVPRYLDSDRESLTLVTTNCGSPVENTITDAKAKEIFDRIENEYGVVHDDPFPRNITYDNRAGYFCAIDFELATVLKDPTGLEATNKTEETQFRCLDWSGLSISGKRKSRNQDSLSVFISADGWAEESNLKGHQCIDLSGVIFVVSDGMGGQAAGEVASEMVVKDLRKFLPAYLGDFHGGENLEGVLEDAVNSLHEHVETVGQRRPHLTGMGATLVCGLFHRSTVTFAHVGDSRFYRFHDGELTQLTHDHTYLGSLFRRGKMTELEMRTHPRRNVLEQAIGGGCQIVTPQVDSARIESGDWFLICSDGVIDGLWNKHISRVFEEATAEDTPVEDVAQRISDWACEESGMDDTTLFVVRAV